MIQRIATSPEVHTEYLLPSGDWGTDELEALPFATHGQADVLAEKLRAELSTIVRPDGFRQYTFIHARICDRVPPQAPAPPALNGARRNDAKDNGAGIFVPPIDGARFAEIMREGALS